MTIVIIILVIIAIPLAIAAFMPGPFSIVNNIVIDKPKTLVFDYLKTVKNQDHYNKWVMMDPNMKKQFTGTDGTVGFIYAWQSDNKQVGQGEQEIIKITEGEIIENEIRFLAPFNGTSYAIFQTIETAPGQTAVKWTFNGNKKYPMRLVQLLFNVDKMMSKDMRASLDMLKTNLEK